ncbi:MAG: leucine-rich repeat domain-containing protein [Clostridium sp.]|nr:MAG: leucine-rich repeat domain-containing protein [Clostridium sp.]
MDADAKIIAYDYAFYNCTKLASIDLSKFYDHIGKMAFYATIIKVANLTNATSVGDFAFADCTEITTLNMPIMETIGDGAFAAYSESSVSGIAITSLELPTTLRSIGEAAFYTCLNLKTITIPANVELKGFIFAYNTSLQSVVLDSSIKTIPNNMFYKASALVNINLENVERIEDGAFYTCTKLKNVNLSNLLYVGEDAFAGCTSITSLDMPRIKEIADYAFLSASSVSTINMPVVEKNWYSSFVIIKCWFNCFYQIQLKEISMSAFFIIIQSNLHSYMMIMVILLIPIILMIIV